MTRRQMKAVFCAFLALLMAGFALPVAAQTFSLDLGTGTSTTGRIVQLVALFIVLSFLRSALGVQQTPPNAVLVSLALFLTAFVMAPTLESAYREGLVPLIESEITEEVAFERVIKPVREFMMTHVREQDLKLFLDLSNAPAGAVADNTPLRALVPAFMISELRRAFEIGFLLFLPFVIIDMVVASVLMSMGMMMLPPVMISLPFKLIFFVLVDGWYLVAGSLVQSFGGGGG
jgi:flagellar biosynthetic protein FliP